LLSRSTAFSDELSDDLRSARVYQCDASDPVSVERAFSLVRAELGEVDVLIYNAGSGSWQTVEDITPEDFEHSWRVNALGALVSSQQVIPDMKERGSGQIIIVGATASLRGRAKTTGFAAAKAAQRSLAQSMARHLGPQGVHVSLLIVDGVIDIPRTRKMFPERPDELFLNPDDIAATALFLTRQPRNAWTFEVDLRPSAENW